MLCFLLGCFAFLVPVDGATLPTTGPVTLTWERPSEPAQYHLRVAPFNDDGPGVDTIIEKPSYTIEAPVLGAGNYTLLPDMSYAWQVRASPNGIEWGAWSEPWRFRTPLPNATLSPVSPTGFTPVSSNTAVLRWATTDVAVFYYDLQVSTDVEFRTEADAVAPVWSNFVHGGASNPPNSWETPPLDPGKTYYWRVRPRVQGDGTPVPSSQSWRFTTAVPPLVALGNEALTRINEVREARGLTTLKQNDLLAKSALLHSQDMAARGFMSHTGGDGSDPGDRIRRTGYQWRAFGEIVAMGYDEPGKVLRAWMDSPTHREVILTSHYLEFGAGLTRSTSGKLYWTVNFGWR